MRKIVENFTVISNEACNLTNFHITLQSDHPLAEVFPGQFTNIEIPDNKDVFLRRPFSIFEVNNENRTISVLVKVLGRGSLTLSEVRTGSRLSLIYPLGKGFTLPAPDERILAVGGGSGVAPVLHLVRYAETNPGSADVILGAKSETEHLNAIDSYGKYAGLHYTTDDGTMGVKGLVTDHPLFGDLARYDRIYACGPLPMMKAVAREALRAGVSCEVSLENLMACGFGVCLCCIEPTVKGNLCVCTEGPVFNINDLKW
ncbi:MAG: dihydroorotate dehydrogenase electron transfer subunit [Bacteroidota bacterium]